MSKIQMRKIEFFTDDMRVMVNLYALNERKKKENPYYTTMAIRTLRLHTGTVKELREHYKDVWLSDNDGAEDIVKRLYISKLKNLNSLKSEKVISKKLEKANQVKNSFPTIFGGES